MQINETVCLYRNWRNSIYVWKQVWYCIAPLCVHTIYGNL